jgi:hypothetical protein
VRRPRLEVTRPVHPAGRFDGRILAALTLAAATCVHAAVPQPGGAAPPGDAPVYRCGNLFTQVPCPDATSLDIRDPRSEEERQQGADVAAREKRLAATLEAERHARERLPAPSARPQARSVCVAASGPAAGQAVPCPARRSRDKSGSKASARRASDASLTIVRMPAAPSPGPSLR